VSCKDEIVRFGFVSNVYPELTMKETKEKDDEIEKEGSSGMG